MTQLTSYTFLANNGLLKQTLPHFTPRAAQQEMAEAVEAALADQGQLIVEAGTGTGKTFGYLIPIFLSQKKALISTGTKNLQDQLYLNDVPVIKNVIAKELGYSPKVVLLKGRANYLCLYRLHRHRQDGRFATRQLVSELEEIYEWSAVTKTGDIAELSAIPEDSAIWPYATSTADNCLNQDCPFYKDCHVVAARQEAMQADIVIVNHHLFFADMALQDGGFGELLPTVEVVVFDEAHHLGEIAAYFFSTVLSSRQLTELARDCEAEVLKTAQDMQAMTEESLRLQRAVQGIKTSLGDDLKALPWPERLPQSLIATIHETKESLKYLVDILKEASVRNKELENCWKRATDIQTKFNLLTTQAPANTVHWYEVHSQTFTLHLTPLIVAEYFQRLLQRTQCSWIFTSATLAVKNSFALFKETLGLDTAKVLQLKSPFDYQKQALLYAPRGLPDVRHENYIAAVIDMAIPVIEASQGKAFLLFTSHRALEKAALYLENRISFPVLRQGEKPKRQLIEDFKAHGNAVLLGTSSFWYGVDVRGDALSCVIIDKLPFAAPDDPILKAKINLLRKQNIDPFQHFQLPQAVLMLKQGAGRLIRDITDKGILVICDPRLVGNRYGEVFLQSLPAMSRTRELDKVKDFFKSGEYAL